MDLAGLDSVIECVDCLAGIHTNLAVAEQIVYCRLIQKQLILSRFRPFAITSHAAAEGSSLRSSRPHEKARKGP